MSDGEGTCPVGGTWYACNDREPFFFGCCLIDPCGGRDCSPNNLRAAGLGTGPGPDSTTNDSRFGQDLGGNCKQNGEWYTCYEQTPTFQGCCEVNPCGGARPGCPASALYPAAFANFPQTINSVTTLYQSSASTSTSTPSANSQSTAASSSSPSAVSSPTSSSGPGINLAAIIGGVLGTALALLFLGVIYWCCRQRRRRNPTASGYPELSDPSSQPSPYVGQHMKETSLAWSPWKKFFPSPPHSPRSTRAWTPGSPPPAYGYGNGPSDDVHQADNIEATIVEAGAGIPSGLGVINFAPAELPSVEGPPGNERSRAAGELEAGSSSEGGNWRGSGRSDDARRTGEYTNWQILEH